MLAAREPRKAAIIMSNPILHGLEVAGKDVAKVVEYPFVHTAKFITVMGTLIKESTPVKDAIVLLVRSAESVDADVVAAINDKGLSLPEDLKTIADVKQFFELFKNQFLPVVEAAYKELAADVK
jgi:hypothetical protein